MLELEGDGVVGVALGGANLNDVHIGLGQLQKLQSLFHRVAPLGLLGGELDLHQHIVAGGLLDLLQHHQGEAAAVLEAAAELVGALVGQGGEQLAGQLGPVAHVQGHRVKAQTLIEGGLLTVALGDLHQVLGGHLIPGLLDDHGGGPQGHVNGGIGVDDLHLALLVLIAEGLGGGKQGTGHQSSLVVHGFDQLHHVVLAQGVAQIELREMGHVQGVGELRSVDRVLKAGQGHKGRTGLRPAQKVGNGGVSRVLLRPLGEMGQGIGGLHAVFEDKLPTLEWGKQMRIGLGHSWSLLLEFFVKPGI